MEDCTRAFPGKGNWSDKHWLMHAVCQCVDSDALEKIVATRDKTGKYEAELTLNGERMNVMEFFEELERQFETCVKKEAALMLKNDLDNIHDLFDDILSRTKLKVKEKLGINVDVLDPYED
jgi:hypothetical protein